MADFLGMMKQAAQRQSKLQAMHEEPGRVGVEGIPGGDPGPRRLRAHVE